MKYSQTFKMTTGHWNPGYENIVSNFVKSKDQYQHALPGTSTLRDIENKSLDRFNLDDIRKHARDVWSQKEIYDQQANLSESLL